MIVRKVVYNNRCSCCGKELEDKWVDDKDVLKESFIRRAWRTFGGRDYCRDCWERDADGSITTRDGRRFDGDGRQVKVYRFDHTGISGSMTLTEIATEIAKTEAMADLMVGWLYKSILLDEVAAAREFKATLLVERKGTWEYDCYMSFLDHGVFKHVYKDFIDRHYCCGVTSR